MEDCIDDDVLQWYRQFTHAPSEARDHTTPNFFNRVDEKQIAEFEKEFGSIIPNSYNLFLKTIGDGRLTQDKNGTFSEGYENSFLHVSDISEILQKNRTNGKSIQTLYLIMKYLFSISGTIRYWFSERTKEVKYIFPIWILCMQKALGNS